MNPTTSSVLERNLAALSVSSPQVARVIRDCPPRADVQFGVAEDGGATATIGSSAAARALCSRRRPLDEARRLVEGVDLASSAGIVVLGFGAGHHLRALVERLTRVPRAMTDGVPLGVVFVYEPDVALLRAVLERVDCSGWLVSGLVVVMTSAEAPAISEALRGREALPFLGQKLAYVEPPEARVRIGGEWGRFRESLAAVLEAAHATVATTLVQVETTLRNLTMNLDLYAMRPGIGGLHGTLRGRPAIVVSAGPSLRRNIKELAKPGVRERFVIIAAQTVLKPLLAAGVKPHFVTALDYHEISRRFYEGLTAEDVAGVTLVVEPKANPAIAAAFPGRILVPGDAVLDKLLGEEIVRGLLGRRPLTQGHAGAVSPAEETIPAGATVAHMAYYLARHLGCDPVILMGQDLGFTDGQYYAAGAAIHQVWSGELGAFNTLEMLEWQRIVRGRKHLHKSVDILGRSIYTDVQMGTYLVQFERDFQADRQRGLSIVDATEGGIAKRGADAMTLAAALERFWPAEPLELSLPQESGGNPARLARVGRRITTLRQEVWRLGELCRRAREALEEMLEHHADQARVNRLIARVEEHKAQAEALEPAFSMVQHLNQTGALKRARADRQIGIEEALSPMEVQKRQIERDIMNVGWLTAAADQLATMLDDAGRCLTGATKITRDPAPPAETPESPAASAIRVAARKRVVAMIPVDPERSGLGTPRPLDEPFLKGENPLRLTLLRLAQCRELDGAVLLAADPERARALAGPVPAGMKLDVVRTGDSPMGARAEAIRGARLWARSCWRGGLAGMTVYDEVCCPAPMAAAMDERGIDAAALVGADWALVDPALVDAVVSRYRERPEGPGAHKLTFCQAPPGLGSCVIERSLMRDLADRSVAAGPFATLGGLLGYIPLAPMPDPIARPICVTTEPAVRDAQYRFIPDSRVRRAALARALASIEAPECGAVRIAAAVAQHQRTSPPSSPQELVLELCTGRRTSGPRGQWLRGSLDAIERPVMSLAVASRLLTELGDERADAAVTFAGAGDPLLHPDLGKMVEIAKRSGIGAVHIRTDLSCEPERAEALLDIGADVISVDLMAESAATYRRIMGVEQFERVRGNLERMLSARAARFGAAGSPGGLPTPWIVPRITRCDAAYEEIEVFYDRWIMAAGAAVIDPLPAAQRGERIEPLPLPAAAAWRMGRDRMVVLSDGRVPADEHDVAGERCVGDASRDGVCEVWRRLCSLRHEAGPLVEPRLPAEPRLHGAGSRSRVAWPGEP